VRASGRDEAIALATVIQPAEDLTRSATETSQQASTHWKSPSRYADRRGFDKAPRAFSLDLALDTLGLIFRRCVGDHRVWRCGLRAPGAGLRLAHHTSAGSQPGTAEGTLKAFKQLTRPSPAWRAMCP